MFKRANNLNVGVQLTAKEDSYKQLSINHEQLQAAHDHMTDKCAEAALDLSKIQQELAESKRDLDTSRFLKQVCQHNRPFWTVRLNYLTQNCLFAQCWYAGAGGFKGGGSITSQPGSA